MAACANLGGKGQYGLAFLPQQPHQLVIGTICQADGPLHNVLFSAQSLSEGARRKVDLQKPGCYHAILAVEFTFQITRSFYFENYFHWHFQSDILCPPTHKCCSFLLQSNPWPSNLNWCPQKSFHVGQWGGISRWVEVEVVVLVVVGGNLQSAKKQEQVFFFKRCFQSERFLSFRDWLCRWFHTLSWPSGCQ